MRLGSFRIRKAVQLSSLCHGYAMRGVVSAFAKRCSCTEQRHALRPRWGCVALCRGAHRSCGTLESQSADVVVWPVPRDAGNPVRANCGKTRIRPLVAVPPQVTILCLPSPCCQRGLQHTAWARVPRVVFVANPLHGGVVIDTLWRPRLGGFI